MDYSLYDARKAGFARVVFLIREEMQEVFDQQIGRKYANKMEVEYAYQKVDDLPEGTDIMVTGKSHGVQDMQFGVPAMC